MKRHLGAIVGAVLLLYVPLVWSQSDTSSSSTTSGNVFTNWTTDTTQSGGTDGSGQSGSDTTQSGVSGTQDTFSNPERLPALNLFRDVTSRTGMSWNFSAGSLAQYAIGGGYRSNIQTLSTFTSGLSMSQIRTSYAWAASYSGGINAVTGNGPNLYSTLSQTASGDVRWRLAKTWQLKADDTFFYSDSPFQPFFTYVGNPTPNNPNPVLYFPQAIVEQNQGHLSLIHPLGVRDNLVFGAGESFQRYLRASGAYSLWNNFTYSGSAFYQHAFSSRLAAGGGYQFSALDFGHGQSRSGVGTFEGFVSYALGRGFTVSGWLGPQRTANKEEIPVFCYQNGCFYEIKHTTHFSIAEGATVKWDRSGRDSFGLDFSHQVNNGGGLLGVADIYNFSGTYNRSLNRTWSLGAAFLVARNNSVALLRGNQYVDSTSGTVGVSRNLFNDAWHFNGYYAFVHQAQNYIGLPSVVSTSGIGFTIRYIWNFGIGR